MIHYQDRYSEKVSCEKLSRRRFLRRVLGITAIGSLPVVSAPWIRSARAAAQSLNILVWAGYEEEQVLKPFEEQYKVKVNAKTFNGDEQMFAALTSSPPGTWDVVNPDAPFVERLVRADLLRPLDPADYPLQDFFERFQHFDQHWIDGKMYGVTSRWGFYGIVYNTEKVDPEDMQSYAGLWKKSYQGKVAIYDWYLPNMGCLSLYLGNKTPYDIDQAQFTKLTETLMSLKPQVGLIGDNAAVIQALANQNAWLSIGGEWLEVLLIEQGHPIALSSPREGGVSWTEALCIMKDSQKPELAQKFIQYIVSPEAQAKLAWAKAFHATVPNSKVLKYLKPEQAKLLRLDDPQKLETVLKRIVPRKLPKDERPWIRAWQRFKSA